ncbi:MtrAB system histidine kinase MtrB [Acidipropionibacterium virtanenii]|nr:MtrAB system histidine kinase MtrB [Acidipropionibacterium virtanenii]
MVTTTLGATIIVLLLAGLFLIRQVTTGILQAKQNAAVAEATTSLSRIQDQLRSTDLRTASLYERLNQLADEAAGQSGQYHVIIQGPVSNLVSEGISVSSIPKALEDTATTREGMWAQPTTVRYTTADQTSQPGLAVASTLWAPGESRGFPIYFIFPETQEAETIALVQRVVAATGGLIVLAMGIVTFLGTRAISAPIRQASISAQRVAAGQLDERLPVRGTDDLARLAVSMNAMATELQRQIRELEELSSFQRQFVSDVSHELRTPLTTVRMAADMLREARDETDPAMVRATELLHDELERFESLLADLLEISRFDAGAAVLALDETDVGDLVIDEVEAARPLARRMETPLVVRRGGDVTAEIDARRIRRIIRNLVANALEHGEGRAVEVAVASDARAVAVTVRDHGIGFEPWQAEQVFARFWRADPARVRTVGGTGLGLAISLEDAHLHHGWLQAWGMPRQGAQFRLTVPRRTGDALNGSPLPAIPADANLPALPPGPGASSPGDAV